MIGLRGLSVKGNCARSRASTSFAVQPRCRATRSRRTLRGRSTKTSWSQTSFQPASSMIAASSTISGTRGSSWALGISPRCAGRSTDAAIASSAALRRVGEDDGGQAAPDRSRRARRATRGPSVRRAGANVGIAQGRVAESSASMTCAPCGRTRRRHLALAAADAADQTDHQFRHESLVPSSAWSIGHDLSRQRPSHSHDSDVSTRPELRALNVQPVRSRGGSTLKDPSSAPSPPASSSPRAPALASAAAPRAASRRPAHRGSAAASAHASSSRCSRRYTLSIASLIRSAAEPWISMLIASRSGWLRC